MKIEVQGLQKQVRGEHSSELALKIELVHAGISVKILALQKKDRGGTQKKYYLNGQETTEAALEELFGGGLSFGLSGTI
jgi:hypothetical protein